MKRFEKVPLVEKRKDGTIVLHLDATEASIDWLKYGRLLKRAELGDEEARKDCERMENNYMVRETDD